jgi:hypothetical protein
MDKKIKNIYLCYLKVDRRPSYPYWPPRIDRSFLKKLNIKRRPKRAKREELEKLLTDTFYK